MKVVLSPEAVERLEAQVAFIRNANPTAAERLRVRIMDFLGHHVASFPRAGRRWRSVTCGRSGSQGRVWWFGTESSMSAS